MTAQPLAPGNRPHAAVPAGQQTAVGARVAARQGVLSARRSEPRPDDGRRPVAWLHIMAPPDWSVTPSARSWCLCGYDRHAVGRAAVARLVEDHTAHSAACPRIARTLEGRTAA
ncbi:hypothetical protein SAMN04487983_1007227 [Streptomyces sp. yr375]|uniref:hypothetical protein n=1 Tax=Streptomyces sp. yr375 TaxID=1761906 RepID=UPI0008AAF249|nr:hypothetical protein [Streptomyces sp. yr375]SEQ73621.1 hypothetical protein SAMN04487983_1007227 [Streptomyces sp. yr375]